MTAVPTYVPANLRARRRVSVLALLAVSCLLLGANAGVASAFAWRRVAIAGHVRCLPVAYTLADQERGLQGVTRVVRPMVFAYLTPVWISFWMKDTPVPLTGVWVGAAHRVVGYWHGRPESTVLHTSPGAVSTVIEYRAGAAVPPRGARVVIASKCQPQPGGL